MIPRVGEPARKDKIYKHRPGAYAILEKAGQVLLTFQDRPVPEYQLPGGGIDPGEQVLAALHREILEETGWRAANLRRLGAYRQYTYMPEYDLWAEKVCHLFRGRPVQRIGPPRELGHTAHWLGFEIAAEIVASEGDRMFLYRCLR